MSIKVVSTFGHSVINSAQSMGLTPEQLRTKASIGPDRWGDLISGAREPARTELEALVDVLARGDGTRYEHLRTSFAKALGWVS